MNNILLIGTGGCGNKLLNTAIDIINPRVDLQNNYDYRFINSNDNEIKSLSNYKPKENGLTINGDGTGGSQAKAKKSLAADKTKIINHFKSYIYKYQSVVIMSSSDGGFGSGSLPILTQAIRMIDSDIRINLLITQPKLSSRLIRLENALNSYMDILKLMEISNRDGVKMINSVMFIDNNSMEDEEEFNKKTMELYIDSLELGGGALDTNDSLAINTADGYKAILPLSSDYKTLQKAIDEAIKTSPFVLPPNIYNCTHLGAIIKKDDFTKEEISDAFQAKIADKIEYGNKNYIIVSGCKMPNDHMNMLQEAFNELQQETEKEEETTFNFNTKPRQATVQKQETNEETEKQKLRNMMDADFWG